MPKPITTAISSSSSTGGPGPSKTQTLNATAAVAPVSSATIAAQGVASLVVVPTVSSGAVQAVSAAPRNSVTIVNPTDGKLIYVGNDSTVSSQNGHFLYPGNSLVISGYSGALWVLSSNGGSGIFYTTA